MTSARSWLALAVHPGTPSTAVSAVDAEIRRGADRRLTLRYRLHGELARLRLPPGQPGRRIDGLWQHTCCEAFIGLAGDEAYREFNFSPSGEWAAYAFSATRQRDAAADPPADPAPDVALRPLPDGLELAATLSALALPPAGRPWRIGLSVVVEDAAGALSYWALRHLSPRPDFHHPDAFAFNLDPGLHE